MKLLGLLIATASLAGCVAYSPYGPGPAYYGPGYYQGAPYAVDAPIFIERGYGRGYERGYDRDRSEFRDRGRDRDREHDRDGGSERRR